MTGETVTFAPRLRAYCNLRLKEDRVHPSFRTCALVATARRVIAGPVSTWRRIMQAVLSMFDSGSRNYAYADSASAFASPSGSEVSRPDFLRYSHCSLAVTILSLMAMFRAAL